MHADARPTIGQVYALAGALCERAGEDWPESRSAASELIERLRVENGHPAPRLDDTPPRLSRRSRRRRGRRGTDRLASLIAANLVEELR